MGTQNLHVIKASAGAGKTFTLAKLYIEQLLWDAQGNLRPMDCRYHQHILAITFTNKATAEMKERIVNRLHELSEGTCADYQSEFLKKYPSTTPEQLKAAARNALANILFDFTQFNISTIDSFFQTVLRTFVYELDCEYDYEIQLEDKDAIYQSVQTLFQSLSNESQSSDKEKSRLSVWVKKYVDDKIKSRTDWRFFGSNMQDDMTDFAKVILNEEFMAYQQEVNEYLNSFTDNDKAYLNEFVDKLLAVRKQKESTCEKAVASIHKMVRTHELEDSYFKYTLAAIRKGESIVDKKFETIKNFVESPEKFENQFKKGTTFPEGYIHNLYDKICLYVELTNHISIINDVISNCWKLGFLNKIAECLEQYRKDNAVILISDTTDLIRKVLDGGVPFLYERMGMWLHHYMIDEFQDTSKKQYENFKPLLKDSVANNHFNLIIGDEKQSIYRFRNSDPDLLQSQLKEDFTEQYNDSVVLDTNWRSCKNIIEFNNHFFQRVMEHYQKAHPSFEKLQLTYRQLTQRYPAKSDPAKESKRDKGFVKLNIVGDSSQSSSGKKEKNAKHDAILEMLPHYILDLHENWNFPFGKILILVNTNKEGVQVVDALLEYNHGHPERPISIMSAESLLLKNSTAVRLIISVLRFICSSQNADLLTHHDSSSSSESGMERELAEQFYYKVLHDFGKVVGTKTHVSDLGEALEKVFRHNDAFVALSKEEKIEQLANTFKSFLPNAQKEHTALVGLVDKIIHEYLQPIGLNKDGEATFLMAFQDVVLDFCCQHNTGTIHEFLKFWDRKKEKLAVPASDNNDAVEVMTIHKAKGLERACVIVPLADWEMCKIDSKLWMPRKYWTSPEPFFSIDGEIVPPVIPISASSISKVPQFEPFINPKLEESIIDCLNKTYVAFTRPRQALHILLPKKKDSKNSSPKEPNIDDILVNIFPTLEGCTQQPEENGMEVYTIGEPKPYSAPQATEQEETETTQLTDYTVIPIGDRLRIKLPHLIIDSRESGNRMHRIASHIRYNTDVEKVLRHAERRRWLGIEQEHYWNMQRARDFFHRLTIDSLTAPWFAEGNVVYNERSIFIQATPSSPDMAVRPDRIVITPDEKAIVIDYKFGDTPSPEQAKKYEQQVTHYCQILSRLWNRPIEGYLLYAKSFTLKKV